MSEPPFTDAPIGLLRDLVEERAGVHFGDHDLEIFSEKILRRLLDAGFATPLDYYYFLRYDADATGEFAALVDDLVVNETYFFRELDQLRSLRDDVLRPLVDSGQRPRIWCAAASTGEEPLTIAMLLADAGMLSEVEIVASDISQKALGRARSGDHGDLALRALPGGLPGRWMDVRDGRATISDEIREKIDWRHLNLLDESAVAGLGLFNAILCRNVLIYFRDDTVRRVVHSLSQALAGGGRLFVGTSESLIRFGTLLHCEERNGAFSYFKSDS